MFFKVTRFPKFISLFQNVMSVTWLSNQVSQVLHVLKTINVSKAAGFDNMPAKIGRDGAEGLSIPLCSLINRSFEESLFPTAEKCAIYKLGERSLLDNYRPISVLNVLSKVMERFVYQQLSNYLKSNGLLCSSQYDSGLVVFVSNRMQIKATAQEPYIWTF